jgi:DNA-binding protein YbaB
MFDKMKALLDMQKKLQEVKRVLESTVFDVHSSNGAVTVTMNGSQEIKAVSLKGDLATMATHSLEESLKDVFNKAIKRSQQVAAEKMREGTGFNPPLPGAT